MLLLVEYAPNLSSREYVRVSGKERETLGVSGREQILQALVLIAGAERFWKNTRRVGGQGQITLPLPDMTIFGLSDDQIQTFPTAYMFEREETWTPAFNMLVRFIRGGKGHKRRSEVVRSVPLPANWAGTWQLGRGT